MFDVDKLYTYNYSTKEEYENADRFKEIVEELKIWNTDEAIAGREQFSEILNFINENNLDPNVNEQLQQRLYDIQSDHSIIKSLIAELKEIKGKTKIVLDDEKSTYNDILDLHLAVFNNNNPELYKLIMSPNGFGDLKHGDGGGLAKDIDAIKTRTGRPDYNFLSAQYQMMKFFNGVSGKAGVGVFSSTSMFHAISQDKDMRYVDTNVDSDGNFTDNFDMQFGDTKSTGKIGEIKTLDETGYVSKVIEAFQSASVDNEKEQILYKLNINKHTFATINALALLGFNEATICYFINQPIIEEYVKRMSDKESSLNKFDENQVGDIFELIAKEFKDKYAIEENKKARNYGVEELKAMLEVDSSQRDSTFWAKQLAILSKFKDTNKIGNNLQSVMQTVNAESKGLGKTVFGSLDRQDKIDNIDEVTLNYNNKKSATGLLGAEKILYEVNDKGKIVEEKGIRKSNSMNGFVAEFGTSELNKIGRILLPYDNNIIKGLFKYFGGILQRRGESISKNEEFMSETFGAIKSFIFSNKKLFGEDFDIKTERKRLFVGSYKEVGDGRLEVDIPSLPDIVDGIKATPLGESNALLRSLIPDLSMRTSRVKLIKYTASAGQNLDESELHQAFIALFRENIDIPYQLNGVEMTKNSRELAMDLIKYVYLSGGTQEAIQFTRYIPIDVLNYMGFSDVLKGVAGKFTASTFGIEMKENNIVSSNVTEQILQHNPKKVPVKVKGMLTPNSKENFKSGIKNVKSTKRVDGVEIITEFELVLDAKNPKLSTGEYMVNQPYISGKFDKSRDWVIYKFNGKSYQLIPTIGTFGVSEYDFNLAPGQVAESIIPGRNLKHVDSTIPTEVKDKGSEVIDDSKFNIEKTYNLFAHINDDNQIESVLNLIKDSSNLDPYHKELAENLLQNTHLLATLSKIKIHYSSDLNDAGLFTPYESSDENTRGRIDISNNPKIHRDKSSLDRAILHEINHAYTLRVLRDYEFGRRDLPQNVINAIQKIDILRRSLKYKFKQNDALKKSFERVEKFLNPKTHSTTKLSPEDMITYGLASNVEFVTMAMENPEFRNAIDGLSREFPNETPFLTRLWNALLELIGLQNTSQITKDYITREIFQFIKEINISLDKSIEKPQVIEGFSNSQKYKDVEKALEDLERGVVEELPIEVFGINNPKDYTNHSGGAQLSDTKWDLIGREFGVKNHKHYREPGTTEVDSVELQKAGIKATELSQEVYNEGQPKATIAARQLGRIENNHQARSNYIIRNWAQVKYSDAIYAIGTIIPKGTLMNNGKVALIEQVKGGTGYAVQMAINEDKPVYVFDATKNGWYKYDELDGFVETGTPILTKNFAGIGSRTLSTTDIINKSLQAIRDVYEKTFNSEKKDEPFIDKYKYFGRIYDVIVENGVGLHVNNVGQDSIKKILDAYNTNPNVDIQNGKPFRNAKSKDVYNDEEFWKSLDEKVESQQGNTLSKYELFPGVYANNGQRDAIDRLEEFLNSKEDEFTLIGRGGTGKTTIIKKIIAGARGNVGGITVAHKAKKVLGASIGKNRVKTIASALAIKLDETTGKFEPDMFARKNGRVPIANMDIIIVDEASMISKAMYDEIMTLKKRSAKVIFMGDNAQLPPIGASEESPVFKSKNKYILTEKMRQAKTSPIIGIGTLIANNVESSSPKLKVIPKELRVDSFDQQSGSSVKFTDNESKALDEFVEDFKNANGNPDFVKIVTFNNQNHNSSQSVKNLNEKVRTKLFGKRASEQFIIGEMITAYDTYSRDAGQDADEVPIHNSDDFIINDIELAKWVKGSVSAQSVKDGYRKFDYQYDIIHLSLLDNEGKPILGETVPVIANSSKAKFEADLKGLWSRDKQLAFKLKGEFANLEYGYAITSHKAQGSTYTNVYVMEDNILGPTNGSDVKAKNQSLYVAVSRPTTKLVMISSGQQQQQNVGGEFDFIDPGVDIDKDNFAGGTVEWSLSPSFQEDIDLSLTREEIKMLEAKHGKNVLSDYNQLTDKEKEYIIKCLR